MKNIDPHKLPPIGDPKENQAYSLYILGMKPSKIAEFSGINGNTLRTWIMNGCWAQKKKDLDDLRAKAFPQEESPIVKTVINKAALKEKYDMASSEIAVADVEHWKKLTPDERLEFAPAIVPTAKLHRDTLGLTSEEQDANAGKHITLNFLTRSSEPGFVKIIDAEFTKVEQPKEIENEPTAE